MGSSFELLTESVMSIVKSSYSFPYPLVEIDRGRAKLEDDLSR
jgi:hypothetical protein